MSGDTSFSVDREAIGKTARNLSGIAGDIDAIVAGDVGFTVTAFGEFIEPSAILVDPLPHLAQQQHTLGLAKITQDVADLLSETADRYQATEEHAEDLSRPIHEMPGTTTGIAARRPIGDEG